jgi:hypothetical protein
MSQFYLSKGGNFTWSDAEPMGVFDLPGPVKSFAQFEGRIWVLIDYQRPVWQFWRKQGLHWFEITALVP